MSVFNFLNNFFGFELTTNQVFIWGSTLLLLLIFTVLYLLKYIFTKMF